MEHMDADDSEQHSLYRTHLLVHILDATIDQMVRAYNVLCRDDRNHERMVRTTVLAKHTLLLDHDGCDSVGRSEMALVRANAYDHNTHESVQDIYQIHDNQATNENHENQERTCHNYRC